MNLLEQKNNAIGVNVFISYFCSMRIDILTILPQLLESPFSDSILKRAQNKGLAEVYLHDLRTYSTNKHKKVDDYAFGGGAGMVMTIQPIAACIEKLKSEREYDEILYMTPDGEVWNQQTANALSMYKNIMILCGHYKGIDERIKDKFPIDLYCFTRSGFHCDLHPRWSNNGEVVYFDSIHEGTRQIYSVDVSKYLK